MTRTLHQKFLERETGIEPATNSLEGCDSTTELLPPRLLSAGGFAPRPPTRFARGTHDPRSAHAAHSLSLVSHPGASPPDPPRVSLAGPHDPRSAHAAHS